MKKLSGHTARENSLVEIEPYYPSESENIGVEGYYGATAQVNEKQFLRKFAATLRKHWFLILALNLLVTFAVIVYVAQKPDYYSAQARLQINGETNPAVGASNGGGSVIVNPSSDPAYFTTQLQILEGAGLLRRVVKNLDLEHNEAFINPQNSGKLTVWQNVEKMFSSKYSTPNKTSNKSPQTITTKNDLSLKKDDSSNPDAEAEQLAPYVALLKRNLTINPVKDSRTVSKETRLIEIGYTHGDPEMAAKITNAIGDIYVLQNLEQKIKTNNSAGDFLQKRVADLQSEIRQGEERLINYSKDNQIVSLDAGQNTVVQRFADLNLKLGQAENERIAAQTAYQAAMQNQVRDETAQSKDPQVATLESKLNDLRQKLAQLKTEYTDEWYEVVQTKNQIQSIEGQLQTLRKRTSDIQTATLQQNLDEATARERELRDNFEKQRADVIRQNQASINYKIIQQEIDTNKALLNGLLQRSRENDVVLNGTPNNVMLIDRALVPRYPVGPQRIINVILAFLLSLVAGLGLAFLLDWLNDSINHSDDVESLLGLPLLATIPAAPVSMSRKLLPKKITRKKNFTKDYNLQAFDRTEFQESYLQLRTNILLSTPGGAPQTILVASAEESEGKTLTALNLAKSLSETGSKVLLIDADLRYPKLHCLSNVSNATGLTNFLTAKEISSELIDKTIQKNLAPNLDILTSGERSANPANLLTSEEMRNLITVLSNYYTYIIIDSPPVLYFADSAILSAIVQAVIVVVRDSISSKQIILQAKKNLQTVGANIIGIVLNGIPLRRSTYYKYQEYEKNNALPPNVEDGLLHIN